MKEHPDPSLESFSLFEFTGFLSQDAFVQRALRIQQLAFWYPRSRTHLLPIGCSIEGKSGHPSIVYHIYPQAASHDLACSKSCTVSMQSLGCLSVDSSQDQKEDRFLKSLHVRLDASSFPGKSLSQSRSASSDFYLILNDNKIVRTHVTVGDASIM